MFIWKWARSAGWLPGRFLRSSVGPGLGLVPRLWRSDFLGIVPQPFRVCVRTGRETQQVPPLRYAPVGMTILLHGQVLLTEALAGTAELSSRPERSAVEGPAVFLFQFSHRLFRAGLILATGPTGLGSICGSLLVDPMRTQDS